MRRRESTTHTTIYDTRNSGSRRRPGPTMRWRRSLVALACLALLASACGSSADESASTTTTPDTATTSATGDSVASSFDGDSGSDFCDAMRRYEKEDPLDDLNVFSTDFVERSREVYDEVLAMAPDEIKPAFEVLRENLDEMGALLEGGPADFADPDFAAALEALDTPELTAATADISNYLADVCGIASNNFDQLDETAPVTPPSLDFEDLGNIDDMTPAEFYQQIFGIDAELAECLAEELGEFDNVGDDPAIFNQEFCGMTFAELMQQLGS